MQQQQLDDSVFICRYYLKEGPLIRWETYSDINMENPLGRFAWYNKDGSIDSMGNVYMGKKDGTWNYAFKYGKKDIVEEFDKGKFLLRKDPSTKTILYANGNIESMEKPVIKDTTTKEKVFTVIQIPAEYKGGTNNWVKYISENLKVPERFMNLHKTDKNYKGVVFVNFIIDVKGKVTDIFIEKSCDWSTDSEAIRVLQKSPKWKPAIQNGAIVKYRLRQALTFEITED